MANPVRRDMTATVEQLLARYERIIEISQQLNSTLDHVALLNRIVSAAMELTSSEASSILLIDPATGELRFEQASNMDASEMQSIIVPLEGSIAGWVVTHGEPRVIENTREEPGFYRSVDDQLQFETRNLLAVPMRAHNRVIGALEAVNKRDGYPFNAEDIKTLTTLAGQAAIAIENARLFQQSDFMAEMVHELRTPLAALKTSTALLMRPNLPDDKRMDIIATMQGETDRLIRMTSDYLDLARLESGRVRLEVNPFELTRLIHETIDIIASQAESRGIVIHVEAEDFVINGDRGKIKQVLLNLLTNAVKYNRENGAIYVRTARSSRHDSPYAEISVADTGYGISKEHQKQMFQKFFRASNTSAITAGTGLGLAIAKHIVEGHNGLIWMDSELDRGSTFVFTLPIASQ
ncbi:GAF domain-containing sensor histidine kinase [Anaerolineae bacterium CFX9]|nr:GAF domain-containing sensor histidine kinase [Anaerolineae bacterium CFX9]